MILNNNIIILLLLLILIIFLFSSNNTENFSNQSFIGWDNMTQRTQNYNFKHKNIINNVKKNEYMNCEKDEIQIGEMCKNLYTEQYRRICKNDEKYSSGYCVKKCSANLNETGNQNVCLSKCPEGTIDDGYNCIDFKFIAL